MAERFIINSQDSTYEGRVEVALIPDPGSSSDPNIHPALLSTKDVHEDRPEDDVRYLHLNLEDIARLGRIAQAIIDGRPPSSRNYDSVRVDEEGA